MGNNTEPASEIPIKVPVIIKDEYEVVEWREFLAEARAKWGRIWRGEWAAGEKKDYVAKLTGRVNGINSGSFVSPKRRLVLKGRLLRTFAILIFMCFVTLVFWTTFYALIFAGYSTNRIVESVKLTAVNIHGSLAETYDEFRNPGGPQEVADLMLEWYELLSKMGYFELYMIGRPPHSGINTTQAMEAGLSDKAIRMIEMLPYVGKPADREHDDGFAWDHGGGNDIFILYGCFVDYRTEELLETPRDPAYGLAYSGGLGGEAPKDWSEEGGQYMRPSYVELMKVGNHGSYMILNTDNYRIWTVDSESGNSDPATQDVQVKEQPNSLDLNNYPSRPARLVIRDYIQRFIDLEWMPGGLRNDSWEGDEYARLYLENGWPNNFNRSAFMIARAEWEEIEQKRWENELPIEELFQKESQLTGSLDSIQQMQKLITEVENGAEVPSNQKDRVSWRKWLVNEIKQTTEMLPKMQANLEAAREAAKRVDPTVRKQREERIKKYGW